MPDANRNPDKNHNKSRLLSLVDNLSEDKLLILIKKAEELLSDIDRKDLRKIYAKRINFQVQDQRYEDARNLAEVSETKRLTMDQIEELSLSLKDKWLIDNRIDVQRLRIILKDKYGIKIGNNKGYELKAALELHHPELLDQSEN